MRLQATRSKMILFFLLSYNIVEILYSDCGSGKLDIELLVKHSKDIISFFYPHLVNQTTWKAFLSTSYCNKNSITAFNQLHSDLGSTSSLTGEYVTGQTGISLTCLAFVFQTSTISTQRKKRTGALKTHRLQNQWWRLAVAITSTRTTEWSWWRWC